MKKNIVLTGFMGTGKTAVGKELAKILDRKVIDIDEEIEKKKGMAVTEIFREFGEEYFRTIETETIRAFAKSENLIIATGGGAVLRSENMDALKENGVVFCLCASPRVILDRTKGSEDRPLLNVENPAGKIEELLACRKAFYEKAGFMIDTEEKSPSEIAYEIVELMKCGK